MTSEFENDTLQAERKTRREQRYEKRQARIARQANKNHQDNQNDKSTQDDGQQQKIRLIPIWLRLLLVSILLFISVIAGLMFGYGVIGDGQATDILKKSTWDHMIDLVKKDTPEK